MITPQVSRMALVFSAMPASFQLLAQGKERPVEHPVFYRTIQIDGLSIFYREAGPIFSPPARQSLRSYRIIQDLPKPTSKPVSRTARRWHDDSERIRKPGGLGGIPKEDSPRHTKIGGLDFYVDTWVGAKDDKVTRGSDGEHIRALIRAHGYKRPAGMMYVRLVHLLDRQKRKELMVIFGENLAPNGAYCYRVAQRRQSIQPVAGNQKSLIERTEKTIKIR